MRDLCGVLGLLLLAAPAWGDFSPPLPIGSQFQVNTYTTSYQRVPAVSLSADGDFVVVWESNGSGGGDTSGSSVQGQRYAAGGTALGGQFQVNAYTTNGQGAAAVSLSAAGDFVVVWESNGSSGGDTSLAQRSWAALRGGWRGPGGAVSGQYLHHELPAVARGLTGRRRELRGGLGQRRLERRRHVGLQHSGSALRGGRSGVGGAVSGQLLHHVLPAWLRGLAFCRR